jgi:hypothetical protein
MKKLLSSVILVMFMTGITHSQELLWSQSENSNDLREGKFVETDALGNIYVGAKGNDRMYLIKYDQNGIVQFISGDDDASHFNAMIVTPEGRSFLAGNTYNTLSNRDGLLNAYDAGGISLYSQQYNFSDEIDSFQDIFVDDNNTTYVAGEARNATDRYALIVKYSPEGVVQYIQHYCKIPDRYHGHHINVNSAGQIYITGTLLKIGSLINYIFIVKYEANFCIASEFEYNIGGYKSCFPTFTLLDDNDNLYVGGYLYTNPEMAGFLIKVAEGNLVWTKIITSPDNIATLHDATFDAEGNIIVVGSYKEGNSNAYYARISPTGNFLFEKTYNGSGNEGDAFYKVITKGEFIYLCGESDGIGTLEDHLILKTNSDGETMWEIRYNGSSDGEDVAYDITLDNEDNVIVTGMSTEQGGEYCTTMKFSNPLGITEDGISEMKTPGIYPNPASSILHIDYEAENRDASYTISDIRGKILSTGILNNTNQGIDIAKYSNGIYLISIEDGLNHLRAKFVKH